MHQFRIRYNNTKARNLRSKIPNRATSNIQCIVKQEVIQMLTLKTDFTHSDYSCLTAGRTMLNEDTWI